MKSSAETVEQYLEELTPERREAVSAVRDVILANLPEGYEEKMDFGMIAYVVPLARYPKTYNGHPLSYAGISSEKNHVSVHLMNIYADAESERWFVDNYKATGKKLDIGEVVCAVQEARRSAVEPDRRGDQPVPDGRVDSVLRILASSQEVCWIETGLGTTWCPDPPVETPTSYPAIRR